ncbi:MAG: hypothetical protein J5I50_12190 [Chitinophagaceae bacterium]|nr:hypothetical protein [Chitinophagaceae bacterium]
MKTKILFVLVISGLLSVSCNSSESANALSLTESKDTIAPVKEPVEPVIDTALFHSLNQRQANGDTTGKWPAKMPVPLPGAIFPFHRVVAFYGNLYSTRMGILGEIPKKDMLAKLKREVEQWQKADSSIPVIPALHYIAVTAQQAPGPSGKYRLRMPFHQIDTILNWSKEINALTFVDIQVGHSTVQEEVPALDKYLQMPTVHLGIDPEFSMKGGHQPGKKIGTFDAVDINWVIDHLAKLVKENNLPPKILILHRFTQGMMTNYQNIKKLPEVQVVVDMDGWGPKFLKRSTWLRYVYKEPVQFTGFKIFYKNDTKTGADQLYTPEELLKFTPQPNYIQYQ